MIVSLFTKTNHDPSLSFHGEAVKIDFGPVLLELDIQGFKNVISSLITQAAKHQIYIRTLK